MVQLYRSWLLGRKVDGARKSRNRGEVCRDRFRDLTVHLRRSERDFIST